MLGGNSNNKFVTYDDFVFINENKVIYELLMESMATAKKRFVQTGKIDNITFKALVDIDPSKTKKYLDKLCEFYLENPKVEELEELIKIYDNLVTKKLTKIVDINKFKSFKEFSTEVNQNKDRQSKTAKKKEVSKDAEVILDNDEFFIISPQTHGASCIYGAGTKWCTTMKDSYEWDKYISQFVKFYYIRVKDKPEKDRMYKIAVAVYPTGNKECFDATDDKINFKEVLKLGLDEKIFKSDNINLEKLIKSWIYGKYEIDKDGYCNVDGSVEINKWNEERLPIKFGKVREYFYCHNLKLETLEGCPEEVGGDFKCSGNVLINLKGCPKKVGGNFICKSNKLVTLEYSPKEVNGNFDCSDNKLTSLKGCSEKIDKDFDCSYNKLINLNGCPKEIGGDFNCGRNELIDLEGSPRKVGRDFICTFNKLTSLDGAPKEVGRDFKCLYNKAEFNEDDVKKIINVKGNIESVIRKREPGKSRFS